VPIWQHPRKVPPTRMDAGRNPYWTRVSKKQTRSVFTENLRQKWPFRGEDGVDAMVVVSEIRSLLHDHPNADFGLLSGRDGGENT